MIFRRQNKLLRKMNEFLCEENRDLRERLMSRNLEIAKLQNLLINQNMPERKDVEFSGCTPDGLANMVMRVSIQAEETEDEFIFTTIRSWCLNHYQIVIKKDELKEMMSQYLSKKREENKHD